jgi:hypothetical protein
MFAGEPDAGNLQVRFDEGEWQARVQRPCHSLLYRHHAALSEERAEEPQMTEISADDSLGPHPENFRVWRLGKGARRR